jgi:hypothetical protein
VNLCVCGDRQDARIQEAIAIVVNPRVNMVTCLGSARNVQKVRILSLPWMLSFAEGIAALLLLSNYRHTSSKEIALGLHGRQWAQRKLIHMYELKNFPCGDRQDARTGRALAPFIRDRTA